MKSVVVSKQDLENPVVRRKVLSASSLASHTTIVDCGPYGTFTLDEPVEHGGGGEGPSPLQGVLGCLCGCEAVTFRRTADDLGFSYQKLDFDAAFTIDIRGRMGVRGVVPHFQTVRVQATVTTDESEERLREVVEETEARCPVLNLLKDANVRVEMVWVCDPAVSDPAVRDRDPTDGN